MHKPIRNKDTTRESNDLVKIVQKKNGSVRGNLDRCYPQSMSYLKIIYKNAESTTKWGYHQREH